ncbi:MAG: radical SAM protein [Candidatus Methanofastidiosia archaeon]|jgi:radical SAM protein with 4Fe4S-binding SPASM domain
MKEYPVLNKDIYCAKEKTDEGTTITVENLVTKKDYRVNLATAAFLELCTGTHSLTDIAEIISQKFDEPLEYIVQGIQKICGTLQKKGLITLKETPLKEEKKTVVELQGENRPYFAHVELTNACNLSCLHCANDSGNPYPDELTTQEILDLIDTLHTMGVTRVVFTGGEPLLHPDLYTIINHAKEQPMIVDIFTNSTLITEEHCKKFAELGVRKIATSIDSIHDEVHDTFRGQKGALNQALKGINLLLKAGFPVRVSISLSQLNIDHYVDMIKYLADMGLTDYQVAPVKYSGRGRKDMEVSVEEYYTALVDEYKYLKEERPEDIPEMFEMDGCGIARDGIFIKADGTVLPCHGCPKIMAVGNVKDKNLITLWNTDETLEMYRQMKPRHDDMCKECEYLSVCSGCIADAFICERSIRCYSPYACAGQRAYHDVFEE